MVAKNLPVLPQEEINKRIHQLSEQDINRVQRVISRAESALSYEHLSSYSDEGRLLFRQVLTAALTTKEEYESLKRSMASENT